MTSACPIIMNCLNNVTNEAIATAIADASKKYVIEGAWSKLTDIAVPLILVGLGAAQSGLSWWNIKSLEPKSSEQELLISEDEAEVLYEEDNQSTGENRASDGTSGNDIELQVISLTVDPTAETVIDDGSRTIGQISKAYGMNKDGESCINPTTYFYVNAVGMGILGCGALVAAVVDQGYSSLLVERNDILLIYENRINASQGCFPDESSVQTFNNTAKYFIESTTSIFNGEAEWLNRLVVDFVSSSGTAKIAVGTISMIFAATVFTCDILITGRRGQRKINWLASASFAFGSALIILGIYQCMQANNVSVGKNMKAGWIDCTDSYPQADWID